MWFCLLIGEYAKLLEKKSIQIHYNFASNIIQILTEVGLGASTEISNSPFSSTFVS